MLYASTTTPIPNAITTASAHRDTRHQNATGSERTVVEGFRKPRMVGGLGELIQSAAGFSSLDLDLLRAVLEACEQKAL